MQNSPSNNTEPYITGKILKRRVESMLENAQLDLRCQLKNDTVIRSITLVTKSIILKSALYVNIVVSI